MKLFRIYLCNHNSCEIWQSFSRTSTTNFLWCYYRWFITSLKALGKCKKECNTVFKLFWYKIFVHWKLKLLIDTVFLVYSALINTVTENYHEIGFRVLRFYHVLRKIGIIFAFFIEPDWTCSPTGSVNFWLRSLFFSVSKSCPSVCCSKQWLLKPVSRFVSSFYHDKHRSHNS